MKIPLLILENRIQVNTILRCLNFRLFGNVIFIVDTGSPLTILSEGDALRLNVSIKNLRNPPDEKKHIYMGGSISELKMIPKKINLTFKNKDNKTETIILSNLCVAIGTKRDERHKGISQGSSSVLGLDFLKDNEFLLYVNPKKDLAYLEKWVPNLNKVVNGYLSLIYNKEIPMHHLKRNARWNPHDYATEP